MKTRKAGWFVLGCIFSLPSNAQDKISSQDFAGMWSDPPPTIEGMYCFGGCTDEGLEILYGMLDDPANDAVPLEQLIGKAFTEDLETELAPLLTDYSRPTFPLDQAKSGSPYMFFMSAIKGDGTELIRPFILSLENAEQERNLRRQRREAQNAAGAE